MSVIPQIQEQRDTGGGNTSDELSDMLQRCSINNLLGRVGVQIVPNSNSQEPYPNSPEAAQTPKSVVPYSCFPPTNAQSFISYSEVAIRINGSPEPSYSPSLSDVGDIFSTWPNTAQGLNDLWTCEWDGEDPRQNSTQVKWTAFATGINLKASWFGPKSVERPTGGGYSSKVFAGGLPWDITEPALHRAFEPFGTIKVEWPIKDGILSPRGYAYITFESEQMVRSLLSACERRPFGAYFFRVSSRKVHAKPVQVIPWSLADTNYVRCNSVKLDPGRTVFVGALHGVLSANSLAIIMDKLFGGVVYAGLDTDKNKYPIGSGRVTFDNVHSYMKAVKSAFIEVKADKLYKKIQVDPYLEDSICSVCKIQQGPYFCREVSCFQYFCRSCWQWQHTSVDHKALTRNSKSLNGEKSSTPFAAIGTQPRKVGRLIRGSQDSLYNGLNSSGEQKSDSPSLVNGGSDASYYNHELQYSNHQLSGGNGLVNGFNHDFNGPGPNLKGGGGGSTLCNGVGYTRWAEIE